ncbi:MAG TPA: helix-turn-helix transcriptional regulator [Pseudonocardia sp.]
MSSPNALHELIRQRREELGADGRPVSYEWVAERAGVPVSTVHSLATRELRSLTEATRSRLAAIAEAIGVNPADLEQAAVESMGYTVRVAYQALDDDQEVLIGAYDDLDEAQRQQVVDFAKFLRSQRHG